MEQLIVLIFILGYLAIAFEHPLKINKTGAALFMGLLLWTVYRIGFPHQPVAEELAAVADAMLYVLVPPTETISYSPFRVSPPTAVAPE